MNKYFVFTILFIINNLSIQEQLCIAQESAIINNTDSLIVESATSFSFCLLYKVNKKQTLYQIARKFDISIDSISNYNRELLKDGLKENSILLLPLAKERIVQTVLNNQAKPLPLYYRVKNGENLFHVCKRKLGIPMDVLLKLNPNYTANLKAGDILCIGFYTNASDLREPKDGVQREFGQMTLADLQIVKPLNKFSNGVAVYEYDVLGSGRLFALHNEAEMDSYIEIQNPVLNRKIIAKVIGRIPPIYEKDIQLVVSAEAARLLGSIDKRFFVSIRYR